MQPSIQLNHEKWLEMRIKIGSQIKSKLYTYLEVRYLAREGKERGYEQVFKFEVD